MAAPTMTVTRSAPRPARCAVPPSATRVPGAAGARVRRRLAAAPTAGTVVHAGEHALYVEAGDHVVGLVSRHGVVVSAAIRTALPRLPAVSAGASAVVGDGVLRVADLLVTVDRELPTRAPAIPDPPRAASLLAAALPDLRACRRQLPEAALAVLRAGRAEAVALLLGRGDGLTPVGDDVLVGWLVTSRAAGVEFASVARAVAAQPGRTTRLSATLLADAAEGHCLPELRDLLLALRAGREIVAAVDALLSVGHTSGAGILLGSHLALEARPVGGGTR